MTGERLKEYHARDYITWTQLRAGEMWVGDWSACHSSAGHRSMTREAKHSGGGGFDMNGVAAVRYQRAARFLGPGLFPIAKGVCIEDRPAREFTRERDERGDAAMAFLRLALDQLVVFYRPDVPDDRQTDAGAGSIGADWMEWPADQQPVVTAIAKPRKATEAVVKCHRCGWSARYGEPLPDCGRAGCKAAGSMIIATVA